MNVMQEILSLTNSIFQEPWWLEAVAPGQWDEVVLRQNGKIVGRLPYVVKKRYGFKILTMPKLTGTLGPWVQPISGKYVKQLSWSKSIMSALIENLPSFDFFIQNFHYSITDWLPFYWKGFQQTTKYTYVIDDLSDLDNIWNNMKDKTRNTIRKAEKLGIKIEESDDLEAFLKINEVTFKRQGRSLPYLTHFVRHLDKACKNHQARKIFLAYDNQGNIHAGVYLIYDSRAAYYLMGGGDPRFRSSGGQALAVWESIKFAATTSLVYDFEGSMIDSIERFFQSFGAIQKPYSCVFKYNSPLLKIGTDILSWAKLFKNH